MANARQQQVTGRRRRTRRSGGAVFEMIIILPVILFLVFGMIEFGQYMYIRHAFFSAARDGCRSGIVSGSSYSDITPAVTRALSYANVGYSSSYLTVTDLTQPGVSCSSGWSQVKRGDVIQVTLTVNYAGLPNAVRPLSALTGKGIGSGKTLTASCAMAKE